MEFPKKQGKKFTVEVNFSKILIFFFASALLFNSSYSYGTETVLVNKAFHNREIKIRAGGLIRIDLEELGSAGYTWEIKNLDKEYFEVVSIETESTRPSGDITGKPVIKTFLIRTKKPGKTELRLLHYRPWEGEKNAVDRFSLRIRIL